MKDLREELIMLILFLLNSENATITNKFMGEYIYNNGVYVGPSDNTCLVYNWTGISTYSQQDIDTKKTACLIKKP